MTDEQREAMEMFEDEACRECGHPQDECTCCRICGMPEGVEHDADAHRAFDSGAFGFWV